MTRREFINSSTRLLEPLYGESEASSIALLIAESVAGLARVAMIIDGGMQMEHQQDALRVVERVTAGEPVQYVLGQAWFCGEVFEVSPGVLIPRGETEELVRWVAADFASHKPSLLDMGTGSGAIAVMLAQLIPGAQITATDISEAAVEIAMRNAAAHDVEVRFIVSDILSQSLPNQYDAIVSNPPYIPAGQKTALSRHVVEHEPHAALFVPDHDPLLFYRTIAQHALGGLLKKGGSLYFEVHEDFAGDVYAMLEKMGFTGVTLREDIHCKPRMIKCIRL